MKYVDQNVHVNGMENFWSLLQRALGGTYVSVEPFHLFRYLDEQAYRFNERYGTDLDRFMRALALVVGRRVTYSRLTGPEHDPSVGWTLGYCPPPPEASARIRATSSGVTDKILNIAALNRSASAHSCCTGSVFTLFPVMMNHRELVVWVCDGAG